MTNKRIDSGAVSSASQGKGAVGLGVAARTEGERFSGVQAGVALPWWKEPMMWLVVGLPASVVVAGIWTLILASRSMP